MADFVTSVSTSGYATENQLGDHTISVDSEEAAGPNPTGTLLAAYASCFIVGLRISGNYQGLQDLGEVRVEVTGERDEDGDLAGVEFALDIEAEVEGDVREAIVERALDTCHVGNALREDLRADVRFVDG